MKHLVKLFIFSLFFLTACSDDSTMSLDNESPRVKNTATYNVLSATDITYAEGLAHSNTSITPFAFPQKLDVYYPENSSTARPLFMFIHGGGFKGGVKHKPEIVAMANYFASRGWVFVSIDYRTAEELGTIAGKTAEELGNYYKGIVPQAWLEHILNEAMSLEQVLQSAAMYIAQRDAKAALRWIMAHAATYQIDKNYITVGGASAGSITATTLGISDLDDFRDEISITDDPTLQTTHLNETYQVKSMVHFWGSSVKIDLYEAVYGVNLYDSYDPELFMAHGTERDLVTPYSEALEFQEDFNSLGIHNQLITLEGYGHGAWDATVDGKSLSDLSFDFIVERQGLVVE